MISSTAEMTSGICPLFFEKFPGDSQSFLFRPSVEFGIGDIMQQGSELTDQRVGFFGLQKEPGIIPDTVNMPPVVAAFCLVQLLADKVFGFADERIVIHRMKFEAKIGD